MPTERIAPANARVRNQAMECFKMVAAIFVVFLHVPFPGKTEGWMLILANSAVPLFFAITGYFKYLDKDFCPMDAVPFSRVVI